VSSPQETKRGNRKDDVRAVVGSAGGRRRRRGAERSMVPPAEFTSYYGRPVLKASPWQADIPAYLFLGGLAAGSSLLGAGADVTGRETLKRPARFAALAAISASFAALVHDLGKPSRFVNMLRVMKPTSPMSVGTWILTMYGPLAGLAGAAELADTVGAERWMPGRSRRWARLLRIAGRPAGIGAALVAPAVASYTAVLISDTATPTWHAGHRELPFLFAGSAAAAAGGLGMLAASAEDAGPARRLALGGVVLDLGSEQIMERSMGIAAEPLHQGTPGKLIKAAKALNVLGGAGVVLGRRSRALSAASGAALVAGSACTRFGIFYAGQESAKDPKYTIMPQRQRVEEQGPTRVRP
jgi:formate-dependent nitrite reductase membrane component NrfD